jgi:hypothetical protein
MSINSRRHHWIGIGNESKNKKKAVIDDARQVDTAFN